jgi:hypothetical protein
MASDFIDDENSYPIVWTPDPDTFLPEQSFTLKADVVDSSHSNNVIVGKFVNDYMKNSSFCQEVLGRFFELSKIFVKILDFPPQRDCKMLFFVIE